MGEEMRVGGPSQFIPPADQPNSTVNKMQFSLASAERPESEPFAPSFVSLVRVVSLHWVMIRYSPFV